MGQTTKSQATKCDMRDSHCHFPDEGPAGIISAKAFYPLLL